LFLKAMNGFSTVSSDLFEFLRYLTIDFNVKLRLIINLNGVATSFSKWPFVFSSIAYAGGAGDFLNSSKNVSASFRNGLL